MNGTGIKQTVGECFVTCGEGQSNFEQLCNMATVFAQRKHLERRASEHHETAHRTTPRRVNNEVRLIDEVGHIYLFSSVCMFVNSCVH